MIVLSGDKTKIIAAMDQVSQKRDKYIRRNRYYYKDMIKFLKFNIPEQSRVLEIGCGTGYLLKALNPARGVGIDISPGMIAAAKEKYPHLEFHRMDAENIQLKETFDFIVISDTLGYFEDLEKAFKELNKVVQPGTRIIITYHNFLWQPILKIAEWFRMKMPQTRLNWLNKGDIINLLQLEGFEIIKQGRRLLFPKFFPLLSWLFNKYIAHLPLVNRLCITGYIVARPTGCRVAGNRDYSVSVIIPARNERGNIENAVKRMPRLGKQTEIIFVEGHSTDNTLAEIKQVCEKYKNQWDITYTVQEGKGKGDAVRKGFALAKGDLLMILDGDLTVAPEDLPKFYHVAATGKGEYINGSRLTEKVQVKRIAVLSGKFLRKNTNLLEMHRRSPVRGLAYN